MGQRFETIRDLHLALRKRNIPVTRQELVSAVNELDAAAPFDFTNLEQIARHLGGQSPVHDRIYLGGEVKVNNRVRRTQRILDSAEWRDAVGKRRLKAGLPWRGLNQNVARRLHDALLDTFAGHPKQITSKTSTGENTRLVVEVWKDIIVSTRLLCAVVKVDPLPLDGLRENYASGTASWMLGVRKLLNPEGVLRVGGREIHYEPNQVDRLIGHLVWGLPLDGKSMEPKPAVTFKWTRLADGSGKFTSHIINEQDASAAELKELKIKLGQIRQAFDNLALLSIGVGKQWQGLNWEQRWEKWNQLFPDFARGTSDAMRKAWERAEKNRDKIRLRIDELAQVSESR